MNTTVVSATTNLVLHQSRCEIRQAPSSRKKLGQIVFASLPTLAMAKCKSSLFIVAAVMMTVAVLVPTATADLPSSLPAALTAALQPPTLQSYSYGFLSNQVSKGESRDAFGNVQGGYLVDDGRGSRQYNYYQHNVPVNVPLVARTLASVSSSLPGAPLQPPSPPLVSPAAASNAATLAGRLFASRAGALAQQQNAGICCGPVLSSRPSGKDDSNPSSDEDDNGGLGSLKSLPSGIISTGRNEQPSAILADLKEGKVPAASSPVASTVKASSRGKTRSSKKHQRKLSQTKLLKKASRALGGDARGQRNRDGSSDYDDYSDDAKSRTDGDYDYDDDAERGRDEANDNRNNRDEDYGDVYDDEDGRRRPQQEQQNDGLGQVDYGDPDTPDVEADSDADYQDSTGGGADSGENEGAEGDGEGEGEGGEGGAPSEFRNFNLGQGSAEARSFSEESSPARGSARVGDVTISGPLPKPLKRPLGLLARRRPQLEAITGPKPESVAFEKTPIAAKLRRLEAKLRKRGGQTAEGLSKLGLGALNGRGGGSGFERDDPRKPDFEAVLPSPVIASTNADAHGTGASGHIHGHHHHQHHHGNVHAPSSTSSLLDNSQLVRLSYPAAAVTQPYFYTSLNPFLAPGTLYGVSPAAVAAAAALYAPSSVSTAAVGPFLTGTPLVYPGFVRSDSDAPPKQSSVKSENEFSFFSPTGANIPPPPVGPAPPSSPQSVSSSSANLTPDQPPPFGTSDEDILAAIRRQIQTSGTQGGSGKDDSQGDADQRRQSNRGRKARRKNLNAGSRSTSRRRISSKRSKNATNNSRRRTQRPLPVVQ